MAENDVYVPGSNPNNDQTFAEMVYPTSDLENGAKSILGKDMITKKCLSGPLCIKEGTDGKNLYFGYAIQSNGQLKICFFESLEKDKDSRERRFCTISKNNFDFIKLFHDFGIENTEQLYSAVISKARDINDQLINIIK